MSTEPAPTLPKPPQREPASRGDIAALAAAGALFTWLFWPILSVRWHYYDEAPRYSHCPMLPVVSAMWVWDRWDDLRAIPRRVSTGGVVVAVLCVAAFVYGRLVSMNFLQHLAMLGTLAAALWAVCGSRVVRACAFPLAYLLLTIPLPKPWDEAITQPMQTFATRAGEVVFDAFGWVVVRQGNVLQLPGLKLLMEDACSGVHSLYALVCLGIAWVAFTSRPTWLRIVLVVSTIPIAIAANALRVIVTGILAYEVDPKYAAGTSHSITGMLVFVTGLLMLLFVDWCLKPDDADDVAPDADGAAGA
ncbi:MAG: exosortase/archaeosortase family protein [Planctomycetes bacterium]|nr:exosortase/archaeosortase family protein [Planctomycetota bacterium]